MAQVDATNTHRHLAFSSCFHYLPIFPFSLRCSATDPTAIMELKRRDAFSVIALFIIQFYLRFVYVSVGSSWFHCQKSTYQIRIRIERQVFPLRRTFRFIVYLLNGGNSKKQMSDLLLSHWIAHVFHRTENECDRKYTKSTARKSRYRWKECAKSDGRKRQREIKVIKFYDFYYCDDKIILNKDTFYIIWLHFIVSCRCLAPSRSWNLSNSSMMSEKDTLIEPQHHQLWTFESRKKNNK